MYLLCILDFVVIFKNSTKYIHFFSCVGREGASCPVNIADLAVRSLFSQVYCSIFYRLPDVTTRAECVVSYTSILRISSAHLRKMPLNILYDENWVFLSDLKREIAGSLLPTFMF